MIIRLDGSWSAGVLSCWTGLCGGVWQPAIFCIRARCSERFALTGLDAGGAGI